MKNDEATILEVQGMTCGSCVRHVTAALTELAGVRTVDVQLREGLVVVTHDHAAVPVAQLVDAIVDAGYATTPRQAPGHVRT